MKTGRIKLINFTRKYNGNFGTMYVYYVEMDNNDWGELQVKVENKYKIGDEINYELDSRQYNGNTVWSIKVKTPTAPFGGAKTDPNREMSIVRQSCLKSAVELCVGGKINIEQLLVSADKFVEWVNKK